MSKIRQEIIEEFCRRLRASQEFTPAVVERLGGLLRSERKAKPDDLVKALAQASDRTEPTDEVP